VVGAGLAALGVGGAVVALAWAVIVARRAAVLRVDPGRLAERLDHLARALVRRRLRSRWWAVPVVISTIGGVLGRTAALGTRAAAAWPTWLGRPRRLDRALGAAAVLAAVAPTRSVARRRRAP